MIFCVLFLKIVLKKINILTQFCVHPRWYMMLLRILSNLEKQKQSTVDKYQLFNMCSPYSNNSSSRKYL